MNIVHYYMPRKFPHSFHKRLRGRCLCLWLILFSCSITDLHAQPVLDAYISQAYASNLVLKEKRISLEKSLLAIREARSLFQPTSWLETQYTLSRGGRTISIPVGDLLNPVYNTLNMLTGTTQFPTIENVSDQFLPNNFYDVRVRTTLPIINTELRYNRDIREQQSKLSENEIDIYKRELAKEVKVAYYNQLMSAKSIGILESALSVVNQNLRLNQSLLSNGKGLPAYVTRAQAEVVSVESQLQTAKNNEKNAAAYFNFLLNRSFTDSITATDPMPGDDQLRLIAAEETHIERREELKALALSKGISETQLKMNRSFRTPKLNTFLDLAAQGFNFEVNKRSFYYLGGLQVQIPLYTGKRNYYKIDQTRMDLQQIDLRTSHARRQLELAAFSARNNARNAYSAYHSMLKEEQASAQYYKLIDRGYREGVNSFIEYLDARNQLTSSQLQAVILKYRFLSTLAEYERQSATYDINR
jgi:outer membrane protein TolC